MVKNPDLFLIECGKQLFDDLGSSEARRRCLVKLSGKLADATLFLPWTLVDFGLDDSLGNSFSNLDQHVGEAFETARVLSQEPSRELQLSLLFPSPGRWLLPLALRGRTFLLGRTSLLILAKPGLASFLFGLCRLVSLDVVNAFHERNLIHNAFRLLQLGDGHFVLPQTWHFIALLARMRDHLHVVDLNQSAFASLRCLVLLVVLRLINVVQVELWHLLLVSLDFLLCVLLRGRVWDDKVLADGANCILFRRL